MIFEHFFTEQLTVGLTEYIDVDGIGKIKAKIDSGNQGYNVLHGINIQDLPENKVKFLTINKQTVSFKKIGYIKIHIGSSVKEVRPVIQLSFRMGDRFYDNVEFSVADRTENDEKVLIGEPFLKKIDAVIDVNKEQLQEKKQSLHTELEEVELEIENIEKSIDELYNELEKLNESPAILHNLIRHKQSLLRMQQKELRRLVQRRNTLQDVTENGFKRVKDAIV